MGDTNSYQTKKRALASILTIYGRNPVLEVLQDLSIPVLRVHLATSNKPAKIISEIERQASNRGIEINYLDKRKLSRISKNAKQDQGVAADLAPRNYTDIDTFMQSYQPVNEDCFVALDGVNNPQNVGMIIRSIAAAGIRGLILPRAGCPEPGPLVIKASAGTVFKCPIIRCDQLQDATKKLSSKSVQIVALNASAPRRLEHLEAEVPRLFVLGNESTGISTAMQGLVNEEVSIAMANGVESLNVAVTAALIAFHCRVDSAR